MFKNNRQGELLRLSFMILVIGVVGSWIGANGNELLRIILSSVFMVLFVATLIMAIFHKETAEKTNDERVKK